LTAQISRKFSPSFTVLLKTFRASCLHICEKPAKSFSGFILCFFIRPCILNLMNKNIKTEDKCINLIVKHKQPQNGMVNFLQ